MDAKPARRYDLDWLRVLAFGGVFFYHCARFFNGNDWNIKNAVTSPVVDIFTSIFEMWGMPLLFAVSGASIVFALRARGGAAGALRFVWDRFLRLLVPLAIGVLVLAPPQVYLAQLTHGEFQGSFWQFLPVYLQGPISWTGEHLWYLEYLFLFTVVLLPLFAWLKRPSGQAALARLSRLSARPGVIFLWIAPFIVVVGLLDPFGLRGPGPAEAAGRLMYVVFPLLGYVIYADRGIQEAIIRQRRAALALALATTLGVVAVTAGIEQFGWQVGLPGYAGIMLLGGTLIWAYVLACFGYGMRYLTADRPGLAYANQAVLPFYILHQPVILLIGYFVIPLPLPIAAKYLIIAPIAFAATLALYEYGVRRSNLARVLFGMKARAGARLSPRAASSNPLGA